MKSAADVVVLTPDAAEARQVAEWLRSAGLGQIATARTCDEAIFMLGRKGVRLLIVGDAIPINAERRLLTHVRARERSFDPLIVRMLGADTQHTEGDGQPAAEIIRRPLQAHDVVFRVGSVMQRPDLVGQFDRDRDQTAEHLAAARRMQLGLLPTAAQIGALEHDCKVGVASLYRSGEAVGGDFWGIWPTGEGRFAVAIVDFAGHGLSAALNTFRLHALLSEATLPRSEPQLMTAVLNQRLHALLPAGQYATMVYLHIDPAAREIAWCCAGAPAPMFVSPVGAADLQGRGLPLGVRAHTSYEGHTMRLGEAGILSVFSDGLFESGAAGVDVPRDAMHTALSDALGHAVAGDLNCGASEAAHRLERLRDEYACPGHSDDVMAICVAFGPAA